MALIEVTTTSPGVVQITLNDPSTLNAMSEAMAGEFVAALEAIKKLQELPRVVVLTGAGKAFTAGGHLQMLAEKKRLSHEVNRIKMLEFYHAFLTIRALPMPVIAKINGAAIGAGLCLAAACDIRVAAEHAKLGATFSRIGLYPGMGATYLLPRLLGASAAQELLITGRTLNAAQALECGLVSKVVSAAQLDETVAAYCAEILLCGELAVRRLLETTRGESTQLEIALEREAAMQAESYASADFAQRLAALGAP